MHYYLDYPDYFDYPDYLDYPNYLDYLNDQHAALLQAISRPAVVAMWLHQFSEPGLHQLLHL
jgi:hypothetical protein